MGEADRPAEERLSVLDRPRSDQDVMSRPPALSPDREPFVDLLSIRLALEDRGRRIYVAPDAREGTDGIYLFHERPNGCGASGGPRSALLEFGAMITAESSGREHGFEVCGLVPDEVSTVRVGQGEAILSNNAYLAVVSSLPDSIVVTTPRGERRVEVPFSRLGPRRGQGGRT